MIGSCGLILVLVFDSRGLILVLVLVIGGCRVVLVLVLVLVFGSCGLILVLVMRSGEWLGLARATGGSRLVCVPMAMISWT